jgi:NitT/TauT family transport system ATP-binding protein
MDEAHPERGSIAIRNLSVRFTGRAGDITAVERLSANIDGGQFVAVLGPSGCGKSTLLNAIAGFITPDAGEVRVDGVKVERPGADRGVVFQQPALFPWKTVYENIALGPRMMGLNDQAIRERTTHFMDLVGLRPFAQYHPDQLSGGMQQRVGIARALANRPNVLLMDEPFGALDAQTRELMQESLLKIWDELKTTLVFVTHDIEEALFLAERVLLMSARPGRFIADIKVGIERPRSPDIVVTAEFTALKKQCRDLIRIESIKAFEQQTVAESAGASMS